ncbi:MAG: restriction endonuclease subunit S [Chloroflexi bacterium]|nr:restriction endonuclease subunit S [Chloroflexota bacterium]MBI3341371.1 restriction endonuclease subunit S [Chloroflexota bacterium]
MVNGTLPESWKLTTVNDIADFIRGVSYKKGDATETPKNGFLPILRATNIQDNKLITNDELVFVPEKYVKPEQFLKVGDVVVCMSSGSKHLVGKTAQLEHDWQGSFGTFCGGLRFNNNVHSKFGAYYFQSPYYREFIRKKSSGININNLRFADFETLEIPLPPLSEQERIVSRIEELLSDLEAGVAALERVRAGLKRYKASVLKAAVTGKLLNGKLEIDEGELPEDWRWVTLGELTKHLTSGSRGWAKHYTEEGSLFVRVGNFNRLSKTIDLTKIIFVNAPDGAEANRTRLQARDLLITMTADVGMIGIVDENTLRWGNAYINQHVGLVRLNDPNYVEYVAYTLASEIGQKQFREKQYGATKLGLNFEDIKSLQIPLPPLDEQRRIVAEVERRLSVVGEVESAVDAGLVRAGRLRQSVLRSAFEGKL